MSTGSTPILCTVYFEEKPADVDAVSAKFRGFVEEAFGSGFEFAIRDGSLTLIAISAPALSFLTIFCHAAIKETGKKAGDDIYNFIKKFVSGTPAEQRLAMSQDNKIEQIPTADTVASGNSLTHAIPIMSPIQVDALNSLCRNFDQLSTGRYVVRVAYHRPSGVADEVKIIRNGGSLDSIEINRYLPLE